MRFGLALLAISVGAILVFTGLAAAPSNSVPATPAPTPFGEPAWTHECLGTDDEPPGCP